MMLRRAPASSQNDQTVQTLLVALEQARQESSRREAQVVNLQSMLQRTRKDLEVERSKAGTDGKDTPPKSVDMQRTYIQQLERQLKSAKDRERELQDMIDMGSGTVKDGTSKILEFKKQFELERNKWTNVQRNLTTDFQAAMEGQDRLREQLKEKERQLQTLMEGKSQISTGIDDGKCDESEKLKHELQALKDEREKLNFELNDLNSKWVQLEIEQKKARIREEELEKLLIHNSEEMRELKDRLDEAVETCNESVEVVEVQVLAMEELEGELEEMKRKEVDLLEKLRETEENLNKCDKELGDSLSEKASLLDEMKELEEQMRALVEEVEGISSSESSFNSQSANLQREVDSLKMELAEVSRQKSELERALAVQRNGRNEEMENELLYLRKREDELKNEVISVGKELENAKREGEDLREHLEKLRGEHGNCEEKMKDLEKELHGVNQRLEKTNCEKTESENDLQKAKDEIRKLQEDLENLNSRSFEEEEMRVNSSEWAVQQLASQLEAYKQNHRKICSEKDLEIQDYKNKVLKLEQEVDHREKKRERANLRLEIAREIIEEKETLANQLKGEIENARKQLLEAQAKETEIGLKMTEMEENIKELREKASEMEIKFKEKEEAEKGSLLALNNLREALKEKNESLEKVKEQKKQITAELQEKMAVIQQFEDSAHQGKEKSSGEKANIKKREKEVDLKISELEISLSEKEGEILKLQKLNSELKVKVSSLRGEVSEGEEEIVLLAGEGNKTVKDLEGQLKNCQLALSEKGKEVSGKEGEKGLMKHRVRELERSLQEKEKKLNAKEKELKEVRREFSRKEAELNQEIDGLQKEAREAKLKAKTAEEKSGKKVEELQLRIENLQRETDSSRGVLQEVLGRNKGKGEREKLVALKLEQLVGMAAEQMATRVPLRKISPNKKVFGEERTREGGNEGGKRGDGAGFGSENNNNGCNDCEALQEEISTLCEELENSKRRSSFGESPKLLSSAISAEIIDLKKRLDKAKLELTSKDKEIERLKLRVKQGEASKENVLEKPPLFQGKTKGSSDNEVQKRGESLPSGNSNFVTPLSKSPSSFEAFTDQETPAGLSQAFIRSGRINRGGDETPLLMATPCSVSSASTPLRKSLVMGHSPLASKNEADMAKLHREVSQLKDKLSLSQRSLLQAESEIQNLKTELGVLNRDKNEENEENVEERGAVPPKSSKKQKKRQVFELDEALPDGEKVGVLKKRLQEVEEDLKQKADECLYLEQRAKNLEKTVERWREFEQAARREARSIRQEIELNNKLLVDAQIESERRHKKELQTEHELEEVKQKIADAEQRAIQAERELEEDEVRVKQAEEKVVEFEEKLVQLQLKLQEAEAEGVRKVENAQKETKRFEEELKIAAGRVQLLEKQLDSTQRRLQNLRKKLGVGEGMDIEEELGIEPKSPLPNTTLVE